MAPMPSAPVIKTVVLLALSGAARSDSQRDCRHTFVVRHIADEDYIIVAEAIPTPNEFTPDGLARLTPDGFNSVLRILELGRPDFGV